MQAQDERWFDRAVACANAGRLADAVGFVDRALAADPDEARSLALKAALFNETGRGAEALTLFERALAHDPGNAVVHSNHGNALARLGRARDAVAAYDRALAIDPVYVMALCNRAGQRLALGQAALALGDAEAAVALKPGFAAAHRQKSAALTMLGRLDEALAAIDAAIAADGLNPDSHARRAKLLEALGREGESVHSRAQAQDLDPERAAFLNGRGMARLREGRFREGWPDYEMRWRSPVFVAHSTVYANHRIRERIDLAVDSAALAGRSVLLIDEQGLGDQIMFASILPDLAATGARVTCLCDPRLEALLAHSFPDATIRAGGGRVPVEPADFDLVMGLCSLGRLFRNTAADFPGAPYLAPRPHVAATWRERLGPSNGRLRIGLVWKGGLAKTGVDRRSLSLQALAPLLTLPGAQFVSLQHGDVAAEIAAANARLETPVLAFPTGELTDFEQMAGLMTALDLVVSVQGTAIHLAGALGVPCRVMVPSEPEWRYGLKGSVMPWYGSVKLLRQPAPGAWAPVIAGIAEELARMARP